MLMEGSEGAIVFELNKCKQDLDLDGDLGRVEYIKRAVKVLAGIENRVEREIYISRVANEIGIKTDILTAEVSAAIRKNQAATRKKDWQQISSGLNKRDDINPEAMKFPKEAKAEEGIIAYILKHPDSVAKVSARVAFDKFVTSFNRRVYEVLVEKSREMTDITLTSLSQEFSEAEMGKISGILAKSRDIVIDEDTLSEYIAVLTHSRKEAKNAGEDMSDDEFLAYVTRLSKEK